MLAALGPGVEGELLDLRAADRGMQVVVQVDSLGLAEEHLGQALQLGGTEGLVATALLVATVEQAVHVLFDVALAAADGFGVAEQEEDPGGRLEGASGDLADQPFEQFDGRGLVAVDTGREQQVDAVIAGADRRDFQRALGQPVQAGAVGGELDLLGRLAAGQGQVEQFAEGEHGMSSVSGCGRSRSRGRARGRRPLRSAPSPVAG
ncbi:hypothetical protein PAERUG_E16_London_17_VIM_2_04_14_05971 [Pseudomonas aeruginosa]|nr:hypothetical protein PAERUG_E16_London_17_VIM_2_04_14_05971 [Pseudomonas aeruginosa]